MSVILGAGSLSRPCASRACGDETDWTLNDTQDFEEVRFCIPGFPRFRWRAITGRV